MANLHVGQHFKDISSFQTAVRQTAAQEGWNAKVGRTETPRHFTTMKCGQDSCKFHVRADTSGVKVRITKLKAHHTCLDLVTEAQRSSNGNHKLLVAATREAMVVNPKTPAKEIARQLQHSQSFSGASMSAIYKAKSAILNDLYGDEVESFKRLPAYIEQLKAVDESIHAVIEERDGKFSRAFVSPGACRHAWHGVRRWLAIDATFMKTKYNLRLHLAACMDGTGALIIVAWCFTSGETIDNGVWFLTHLRTSMTGLNDFTSTIVSDRNAALLSAIDEVLPAVGCGFLSS